MSKIKASKPSPKPSEQPQDSVKAELLVIYKQFKEVLDSAKSGLLDRRVARLLKVIDTSKLDELLKGE